MASPRVSSSDHTPAASVIVPARDAAATLPHLLAALGRQRDPDAFEVLVVDDHSTDDTGAVAEAWGARVVRPASRGVYAARNAGIAAARGSLLALTDADCVPADDWVKRGIERLGDGPPRILAGHIDAPLASRPTLTAMLDVTHHYDQARYAAESHAAGGNMWIARDVIDAVGPFDERLSSGGDTEFGGRAAAAGYVVEYAPDVIVHHPPLARASALVRRSFRLGRGAVGRQRTHLTEHGHRGAYVTPGYMRDRLAAAEHTPGRAEFAALLVAKQLLIRAPLLAGNLVGHAGRDRSGAPGPRRGAVVDRALPRKDLEREFHDQQFAYDTRAFFRRFYEVTRTSRDEYEEFLLARCEGRDVLEYGCGDDPFVLELVRHGARGTGIDLSPVAVERAGARAAESGLANARFEVMDGEELRFADDSFDLVCGTGVLHHLDLRRAYAEIARVLRPGGSAIFIEPLGHNPGLRAFRALTPRFRTRDEHPLLLPDLAAAREWFPAVETAFHHFLGLAAFPLRGTRGFGTVLAALDRLDRGLFARLPATRRLAWLAVITLHAPPAQR
jgi:SAM-dependent methyltransferase/GT2 family glycosyltransferase